ncbi:DUF1592 domain-containing protein [Rubripirellula sp.]|nr:DUF1592 domain-containing protein [Rubripirellula sp.]
MAIRSDLVSIELRFVSRVGHDPLTWFADATTLVLGDSSIVNSFMKRPLIEMPNDPNEAVRCGSVSASDPLLPSLQSVVHVSTPCFIETVFAGWRLMKGVCIGLLLLGCSHLQAQQTADNFPSELTEEIDNQLREAKVNLQNEKQRASHTEKRVSLLSEMRRLLVASHALREKLEQVESEEPAAVEGIERRLEQIEISIGRQESRLGIHELKGELLELLHEVTRIDQESSQLELKRQLKQMGDASELMERQFQAWLAGEEEVRDAIEELWERLEGDFEETVESIRIRIEIHYAREEGNDNEADELEAELREIESFRQRVMGGEQEGDSVPDGASLPIELTEDDFTAVASKDYQQHVIPLLKTFCFECHDGTSSFGDLDLEKIVKDEPLVINRDHWLNIIQQIKVRSMPPPDASLPGEAERRLLAAWLTRAIDNFDYQSVQRVGYEPARRLTREEYNNTIRDLVGIDLRPADRFPADMTASSGFRNSANSLFFQPITLERFVGAAEAVVDEAYPVEPVMVAQRQAWQRLLADDPEIGRPDEIIRRFASKAFRRPLHADERRRLADHFSNRAAAGTEPRQAIRDVLKVVLISPAFLFRSEQLSDNSRISDYELATRLSYFLWASMPDDQLFDLARLGRLSDPQILRAQVDRMLDDSRSETLGTQFAAQWFGTENLNRVRPGQIDNPWATDGLIQAMKAETAMLFETLIREDLPIERLLDADFTFLNEELARHYGRDDVEGIEMQRVSLTDSKRRGLLGHGSVLAITSFPGRSSPVMRGNWILSELLGTPPPPPPPNVSQFDERVAENRRLSQRQKLQLHRQNPNCYACHSQIDPLGFALSEFDWFGRLVRGGNRRQVDSSGTLPDGTEVQGLRGLSEAITSDRIGDLSRQAITKMLSYALGRQLEYYDEATVRELLVDFENDERSLRGLVHEIVQTDTFRANDFLESEQ